VLRMYSTHPAMLCCCVLCREVGPAITELESIVLFARTVEMNTCLAKLYEEAGNKKNAANVYK
jgi:hypothetical protein